MSKEKEISEMRSLFFQRIRALRFYCLFYNLDYFFIIIGWIASYSLAMTLFLPSLPVRGLNFLMNEVSLEIRVRVVLVFKITTSLCINLCSICFLRLALNVPPSLSTSPAGSQSIRQAAPHSAQLA